jgi:hypothetical protein
MGKISSGLISKRMKGGGTEGSEGGGIDEAISEWRASEKLRPFKSGQYNEIFNRANPKARWRQQIFKYGPLDVVANEQTLNFSGAVQGTEAAPVKIEMVSLYCSSDLSGAGMPVSYDVFVDKVGIIGRSSVERMNLNDDDYFYTGSSTHNNGIGHYVSHSQDALIAGQERAGTTQHPQQTHTSSIAITSSLWQGGWFTGSADVTVKFNRKPTTAVGTFYLYVYADKMWKAFP